MDIVLRIIFLVIGLVTLVASIMAVTVRDIVHAALWLIGALFGVAALYLLLEAEFLAIVQVLIYAGAVAVLILFAIMLTRHDEPREPLRLRWWLGLGGAIACFTAVLVPTLWLTPWAVMGSGNAAVITTEDLGRAFMGAFVLPFEVVSIILTVALVGAIVVALEERGLRQRVITLAEEWAQRRKNNASSLPPQTADPAPTTLPDQPKPEAV